MSKLYFYFKSGNTVIIDSVVNWEVGNTGGKLTKISITQQDPKTRLIVKSLNLSEIDCITEEK